MSVPSNTEEILERPFVDDDDDDDNCSSHAQTLRMPLLNARTQLLRPKILGEGCTPQRSLQRGQNNASAWVQERGERKNASTQPNNKAKKPTNRNKGQQTVDGSTTRRSSVTENSQIPYFLFLPSTWGPMTLWPAFSCTIGPPDTQDPLAAPCAVLRAARYGCCWVRRRASPSPPLPKSRWHSPVFPSPICRRSSSQSP